MAEAAAVAYGAFEAVETTAQIGVGAYMLAKPTAPLKGTFTQIATAKDDETRLSLARSDHTLSIAGHKAYIFGGETASGKLASNEIHIVNLDGSEENTDPTYSVKAALPAEEGGKVPVGRTKHAACTLQDQSVVIYGGIDQDGKTIDEGNVIWLFNTEFSSWRALETSDQHATPRIRRSARLFEYKGKIILYGGVDSSGEGLSDVWSLDRETKVWTRLPNAPASTSNAAVSEGVLYLVSANDNVSSNTHFLPLETKEDEAQSWTTIPFPTSPLTPGPRPREQAGLLRVSTGYGRNYLVYLFGIHPESTIAVPSKPSEDNSSAQASSAEKPIDKSNDTPEKKDAEEQAEKQGDGEASKDKAATAAEEEEEAQPPLYHSDTWTFQVPSAQPELKATTQIYEALKPAALKDYIRGAFGFESGKHSWAEVEIVPPEDLTAAEGGKVHPGPRARFGGDVMADGKGIVIWGGVNPKGEREGDGWMVRFQ